jgi:aryl carrier-like protein
MSGVMTVAVVDTMNSRKLANYKNIWRRSGARIPIRTIGTCPTLDALLMEKSNGTTLLYFATN